MAYKISVSSKAQKEFHKAIDYYNEVSEFAPVKFINAIQETYLKLAINPFYEIRKNSIRAIPVKCFPFLYFSVLINLIKK